MASATVTMTASTIPNPMLSGLEALEIAVKSKYMLAKAAAMLAIGVKNPITSKAPITITNAPTSQTLAVGVTDPLR